MIRHASDHHNRALAQRRFLAAGIRVRGQWRYLVRSSSDPFSLGEGSEGLAERPPASRPGNHRASLQKRA
jgi:hypothetical protein